MKTDIFLGINAENISQNLAKEFVGVGLIRSEYLCRNINEYITTQRCQKYIEDYLMNICNLFKEKEVWYRFTDLTGNEIATLDGADAKIIEKWHFIGSKGVRRHLKYKETFKQECSIIKNVYNEYFLEYMRRMAGIEESLEVGSLTREILLEGKIDKTVETLKMHKLIENPDMTKLSLVVEIINKRPIQYIYDKLEELDGIESVAIDTVNGK